MNGAVVTLIFAWGLLCSSAPAKAEPERNHYTVRLKTFGWWAGELQIRTGVREDKGGERGITGLACVLRGYDGVTLTLTRPIESGRLLADFSFEIEDDSSKSDADLIERRVVSLGIGGRTYEFDRIQWRFSPMFLGWEPPPPGTEVLVAHGITMPAFRGGDRYPWLPVEYLIPALIEVKTLRLGYRGDKEITHGNYESVYRERTIRMNGFGEGMHWCGEVIRKQREIELPAELRRPDARRE